MICQSICWSTKLQRWAKHLRSLPFGAHRAAEEVQERSCENCSGARLVNLSRDVMLLRYRVSQEENKFAVSPNS